MALTYTKCGRSEKNIYWADTPEGYYEFHRYAGQDFFLIKEYPQAHRSRVDYDPKQDPEVMELLETILKDTRNSVMEDPDDTTTYHG